MGRKAVMACIKVRMGADKQEIYYRPDEEGVRQGCSMAD